MTHRAAPRKVVAWVGDVGMPEYDGGLILQTKYGYALEWVVWPDESSPHEIYRVDLARFDGKKVIPELHGWVNWDSVARSIGAMDSAEARAGWMETMKRGFGGGDPRALADLVIAAASARGWHEFDQYPIEVTLKEAVARYRGLKR